MLGVGIETVREELVPVTRQTYRLVFNLAEAIPLLLLLISSSSGGWIREMFLKCGIAITIDSGRVIGPLSFCCS